MSGNLVCASTSGKLVWRTKASVTANDTQLLVWVKLTHTDTGPCGPVTVFGTLTGEMSFVFPRSGGTATGSNSFEIDEGGGNWTGTARLTPR